MARHRKEKRNGTRIGKNLPVIKEMDFSLEAPLFEFVPCDGLNWDSFYPVQREAIDRDSGNMTFNLLWAQAMFAAEVKMSFSGIGCDGMQTSCAMDHDHNMAIKIVTTEGCKLIVLPKEPGKIDPLEVCLVGAIVVPNVVDEHGRIRFASMIETPCLIELLQRLEKWASGFIAVHGRHMAGLPSPRAYMYF